MAEENGEAYNHYLELSKPTEEDFERVFTEEELKELCLKHKCRVDMYRWNVVNDYRTLFTDSGRFPRWSENKRLKMLAKAVNRMKPSVLYEDNEIEKTREKEWGMQLKENILSLNFWHRKRDINTAIEVLESDNVDREVQSQCEVHTESMNAAELFTQSESSPAAYEMVDQEVQLEIEIDTESMHISQSLANSEQQQQQNEFEHSSNIANTSTEEPLKVTPTKNRASLPPVSIQSAEGNILLGFYEEDYLSDNSGDSVETVLLNDQQRAPFVETLHSEEVAPEIENIYGVNTMSMTISSQMSTEGLQILQSQDVVPTNYDNFKNIIPLTSTQSQSHASEEIIVI